MSDSGNGDIKKSEEKGLVPAKSASLERIDKEAEIKELELAADEALRAKEREAKAAAKEAELKAAEAKEKEIKEKEAREREEASRKAAKEEADRKAREEAEEKARKDKIKADAASERRRIRREKNLALINACPPQYMPVSTSAYFWLVFFSLVPFLGFVLTVLLSVFPRNRNIKHLERAILAYYIIAFLIGIIALVIFYATIPQESRIAIITSVKEIIQAFSFK